MIEKVREEEREREKERVNKSTNVQNRVSTSESHKKHIKNSTCHRIGNDCVIITSDLTRPPLLDY